jgi:hypothetical protein
MRFSIFLALIGLAATCLGQEFSGTRARSTDPVERERCQENLTKIFDALGQYVLKYDKLPTWLNDLVPEFIGADVLICPYVKNTGLQSEWRRGLQQGPRGPNTYYHYEFCLENAPFVRQEDSPKTYRECKQGQMFLLGGAVPIVRCLAHNPVINLAYSGLLFDNIDPVYWEESFAHIYPHLLMVPKFLFPALEHIRASEPLAPPPTTVGGFSFLDLSNLFNIVLYDIPLDDFPTNHAPNRINNLASLPKGVQQFGGVPFFIRGVLHLARKSENLPFPMEVQGIPVKQRCSRMHILHGFVSSEPVVGDVARIVANATNEISGISLPGRDDAPVWEATISASNLKTRRLVLYRTTWQNPHPENVIATLNFASAMTEAAPFLLAITLE